MSGLYTRFAAGLLFPLHERLKRHSTMAVHRAMERSQWWSADDLAAYQAQRLRGFLQDVGQHVPYYRDLFADTGFDPDTVAGVEALQQLPFLTKPVIRDNSDALRADGAQDLARFNTGGSSGEPLIFFIGNERVSHDVAAKWRATRWWDVDIGDREIVLWGSPIELGAQDRVRAIRDRLLRTRLLAAFEMSAKKMDGFIEEIRRFRPAMLFGYPSALALIARHAEKAGTSLADAGIKVAFVTSECLYDEQRADIERVFGCPVANGYGGRDAGFIAHQCPEGGMHITAEDIIVEIVDPEGRVLPPGEAGEVVVTHMATRDYPFIRYRTGDVATLDDRLCPCGRGLPLIKEVQGRTTDFLVASDGTIMHGLAIIYILRDIRGVANFKVIQESLDLTRILLVTEAGFDPAEIPGIIKGARERLGADVSVEVEMVDSIPAEKSGKFRYVVSHVSQA